MSRRHSSALKTALATAAVVAAAAACTDHDVLPMYPAPLVAHDFELEYPTPQSEELSGKYRLVRELETAGSPLFPELNSSALAVLSDLSADPAPALLALAAPAVVDGVLAAAPADIRDSLNGRITDYVSARRVS